jgi:hypothetical protein
MPRLVTVVSSHLLEHRYLAIPHGCHRTGYCELSGYVNRVVLVARGLSLKMKKR